MSVITFGALGDISRAIRENVTEFPSFFPTVLHVSHQLSQMLPYCDEIIEILLNNLKDDSLNREIIVSGVLSK